MLTTVRNAIASIAATVYRWAKVTVVPPVSSTLNNVLSRQFIYKGDTFWLSNSDVTISVIVIDDHAVVTIKENLNASYRSGNKD